MKVDTVAKEFTVGVGAAFDKRLAELVWESCSELAKQTVSGKLAMTVDFNSSEVIHLILQTLSSAVVEKLKPQVLEKLKDAFSLESLTNKLSEDKMISNALRDLEGDLDCRVSAIIEKVVSERVKAQVELIIDHTFGSSFTVMVEGLAKRAIDCHIERRLSNGKPAVVLKDAETQIRMINR